MIKKQAFKLGQVLEFSKEDGHPSSEIVGIDSYQFKAEDGLEKHWKSYTLIPIDINLRIGSYERWYAVDLPQYGMSFVQVIKKNDIPKTVNKALDLSGDAFITTEGDGELGTGHSKIFTYFNTEVSPHQMYAIEEFEHEETLYFKTDPIQGNINIKPS